MYAEAKGFTVTEATNYLVATKISVIEEVEDTLIAKANKDYESEVSSLEEMEGSKANAGKRQRQKAIA